MVPDTQHSRTQEIATRNGDGPSLICRRSWWGSALQKAHVCGFLRIDTMFDLIVDIFNLKPRGLGLSGFIKTYCAMFGGNIQLDNSYS